MAAVSIWKTFLLAKHYQKVVVIVSTRTSKVDEFTSKYTDFCHVNLKGFVGPNVVKYVFKYFKVGFIPKFFYQTVLFIIAFIVSHAYKVTRSNSQGLQSYVAIIISSCVASYLSFSIVKYVFNYLKVRFISNLFYQIVHVILNKIIFI